ncbi:MAG: hypothetical protein V4858_03160 [Pseudomonadota bacterium]
MRIHVTANGKATSISVDETLVDYLGAHFVRNEPKLHANAERQLERAKGRIQEFVRTSKGLPDKDLSQHVQRVILSYIVNPDYEKILETRGPRFDAEAKREASRRERAAFLSNPDNQALIKKNQEWKPTPEQLAAAAERKRLKAARSARRLRKTPTP